MYVAVKKSMLRAFTLAALASLMTILNAGSTRAQWATNGSNINNTNAGGVGVGTSDPSQGGSVGSKFTVASSDDNSTAIATSNGTLPRFALNNHADGSWTMHDFVGNTWNIGITQRAGSVGIGTVLPGFKFDVQGGAINASGGLCIAGDCKTSWSQVNAGQWTASGSNILYNAGGVGVGTTDPTQGGLMGSKFTVANSDDNSTAIATSNGTLPRFALNNHADGSWTMHDYVGNRWNIGITQQSGNVGIGTAAPTSKLHVVGDITVTGNINAKYQDVAEWVPSTEKLSAGMVVVLDDARDNHVMASAKPYDTRVAGVVSAQPGITLGEAGEGKALVATTGRVKVKVDASRGAIHVGDLLVTSDVPGVAMLSKPLDLGGVPIHRPGTLIGKALEPLKQGTGEILVLLSLQ